MAQTGYFDDVRIGKEVLAGSSDAYRKLRNTVRYMLGALADYSPDEAVELGGLMIKVGQFMSSRLDVLPPEITAELLDLQLPGLVHALWAEGLQHVRTAVLSRGLAAGEDVGTDIAYTLVGAAAVLAVVVPVTLRTYMRRT